MTLQDARRVSKEVSTVGGRAEELLRAKCRWEQMTRLAVLMEWGDPREWNAAEKRAKEQR
jgi:hypothetical protein